MIYKLFGPIRFLYKVYFGVIYISTGLLLYPFMLLMVRGEAKYKNGLLLKKTWSKLILIFTFIKVKVNGASNFPNNGPYIVCANHSSYLDIIIMFHVLPSDFAFLGKAEVLKWPIINVFFKRGVDIPVYRGSAKRAKECIDLAQIALNQGRSVAIFPEGGIEGRNLRKFKNGAFRLATDTQVNIVPVAFVNNWKLFSSADDFWGRARPGIARVEVLPVISVRNFGSPAELRDQARSVLFEALKEANTNQSEVSNENMNPQIQGNAS